MGNFSGELKFNIRKQPAAQIKTGELKGGIKREQLSEKSQLIFDAINNQDAAKGNVDNILDANEIQNFWDKLVAAAKNDTLSGREAKKLLKDINLTDITKEDLFAFVNELYGESEDIESSLVNENDGTIIINYKEDEDGNVVQERVYTDHTSEIEIKDANETITTQFVNADDKLTKKTVVDNENNSTTTLYTDENGNVIVNAEGNEVPTTVIKADADEEVYRETVNYEVNEDGTPVYNDEGQPIPAKAVVVDNRTKSSPATVSTTNYEDGIPINTTLVRGKKTSNYSYQQGQPILTSTEDDLGNGLKRTTNFEYNEQGHIEHIIEPNRTIDRTIVNFSTEDNKVVPLTTQEIIKEGTTTTTNQFDYQNNVKYENIVEENGSQTQNVYGMVSNEEEGGLSYVKLQQTKTVNGKTYQVQYDGEGNTCGIVVQFGESAQKIAQRFGCSVNELFEANPELVKGKGRNRYFTVGAEIKVPRELEADAKALQGRDSREVAIQKYQQDKQLRSMGLRDYQRAGETFTYGSKSYKVLGTKTNRERLLVQDSEGRIYTASHDNIILEDSYIGKTDYYDFHPERRVEISGKTYVKAPDDPGVNSNTPQTSRNSNGYRDANGEYHRDQFGRDVVIDYNGRVGVASGSIDYGHNQGRYILSSNYLTASDMFVDSKGTEGADCYGMNGTKAVKVNGETFYFAAKGFVQQNTKVVEKQIAANITADIIDAAAGSGTKNEQLEGAVSAILNPSIKSQVDAGVAAYGDSDWTNVETLISDESNGERYYRQMNCLIRSGAYTEEDRASQVATLLDYELHGGFGITRDGCVKEILTSVDTSERRQAVDKAMADLGRYANLEAYEGSSILAALSDDGFSNKETDKWGAQLITQRAYKEATLKLDEHGQPVRDAQGNLVYEDAGEQQYINNLVGRLCFEYSDKESLHKGLDAINTDNFNTQGPTATYLYFLDRCADENTKNGYQSHFTGQDVGQIYLAGRSDNGGDVDVEQLSACDNLLFNDSIPLRIQAELSLYDVKNGEIASMFKNNMEPEIYTEIEKIIANGDVPNCTSIQDAYNQAIRTAKGNDEFEIKANAIISGKVKFSQKEITDFCIQLMHSIDDNAGKGGSTSRSAKHTNIADYQTAQLKTILAQHPEIIADLKVQVQKGTFVSTTIISTFNGPGAQPTSNISEKDTKSGYLDIIDNTRYFAQEGVFLDENGNQITDAAEIARLTQANMQALDNLRKYVASLEREFKKGVDKEGALSDMANGLSTYSGLGTDRDDVANKYREAKLLLSQMEAAAQGKLRDAQGNVISAQELARSVENVKLYQVNADYQTSQGYWKMGIILAPVIAVTTVASGGAAAAGWGTGATALTAGGATFATEYGLNMLELSTSETGNTAEARWNALEQAVIDGGSVVAGAKFMQLAQMIKIANPAIQGVSRLTTVVASDIGMGAAGEYLISGEVTVEGVAMNAVFSATGNLIGYKALNHNNTPDIVGAHNQHSQSVLDHATVNGERPIGGRLSDDNFRTARRQVQAEVDAGVTPQRTAQILDEASNLRMNGSRQQGRQIQHIVEDGTGVYRGKNGDIDLNIETDITRLNEFRKEVAGWKDAGRDVDAILAKIDKRIADVNANPAVTPVRSEPLDLLNDQLISRTDRILTTEGKNFRIGESDASLIEQRIARTTDPAELDRMLAGIEQRRLGGTRQDVIDRLNKAVNQRKAALRPSMDMDNFSALIETKKTSGKGFSEFEAQDVVRLINSSSDADFAQIETLLMANKKLRSNPMVKKALANRSAASASTPAKPAEVPTAETPLVQEAAGIHVADAPAAPARSEFLEQQFNTKLQESDVWQTGGNSHSVDRLGGEKLGRYTREFDELCRYATTPEQLDKLQTLANKFRGQAENTSFNASIAKRRAELNGRRVTETRINDHEKLLDAHIVNNDGIPFSEINILNNALRSNPLGIKYEMQSFTPVERKLITQVYDTVQQSLRTGKSYGFPEGSLQKLYESGQLTENGICAIFDIGGRTCISVSDYNFFCRNKVKLTSVDSQYIINERHYTATHDILLPDSPSFINQASSILAEQRSKMALVPREGKVVIVSGHPASGKSTATSSVIEQNHYLNVDPDVYKSSFVEFNEGLGTDVVHKASGKIRDILIDEALDQRRNLIVETTGDAAKVQKQIDMFLKAGYKVEIIHINRDLGDCAMGLVQRAETTGRVVPPEILIDNAVRCDYTTIPSIIKLNNPDIKVTTFTNQGDKQNFLNSKKIL